MNCYLPALVCRHFRDSRIVAFSTGNVYGLTPAESTGSREDDPPQPVGEYAMAALGRERMFQYFSRALGLRVALLRLNYAAEMRYSVLVDLAQQVFAEKPIDVTMGYANVIWQGDANAMSLTALATAASPAHPINIAGSEKLSVREVCERFGRLMNKPVAFVGNEAPDALLSDGRHGYELLGRPAVSAQQLIEWTADWVQRGGESHGKPTHFESRDGKF